MKVLLNASDVTIAYGGVRANDAVNITVCEGEFVGLIGANGAGKTSFIDGVTGFTPVSSGRVEFEGQDITTMSPNRRARAGLVRTFQSVELFDDLTVADNVTVALEKLDWRTFASDLFRHSGGLRTREQVVAVLRLVGLEDMAERMPSSLSNGQRKLVGLARSLASRPTMAILDEPAAGLDAAESVELSHVLRGLPSVGTSVLLIDHDMGLVLSVCDRIYVLDSGRIIAHGTPAEIRSSPEVIRAYLGDC